MMSDSNILKSGSRSRAPNFTKEEQLLLCKIAEAYSATIESKKTDGIKQAQKQETWLKIQEVYNANTKSVPRTVENLLSCYRNMKSKIKKQHSGAKMLLQDPRKKEALINALEENGRDWNAVSLEVNEPADVCQSGFMEMEKALKRKENLHKKSVMGTGGGPPSPPNNDEALIKLKKMIEPQVDGLFTIYDGDALLMAQYQESVPDDEKMKPIEYDIQYEIAHEVIAEEINKEDNIVTTPISLKNRVDLLRKKKATPLNSTDNEKPSCKKKENTNATFQTLAESKLELVKLQKQVLIEEIQHQSELQEFTLEDAIKQNEHIEKMRERELQIIELELEDKIAENKFKEQIRERELLLLDLKIKNFK